MSRKGVPNATLEQKAEWVAMIPMAGNQAEVARLAGVSDATISRAVKDPEVAKLANVKKEDLAAKALSVAEKFVERMLQTLPDANTRDSAGAFKILTEGAALLKGEATSITQQLHDLTPEERRNRFRELIGTAKERKA